MQNLGPVRHHLLHCVAQARKAIAIQEQRKGWGENDRSVSFTFGADVVGDFLARHDLDLVVRAHQVVEDGFEFFADRQLLTVFSAPNYCGEFDNCGAMMSVDESLQCSFQVLKPIDSTGQRWGSNRPGTPPRNRKG